MKKINFLIILLSIFTSLSIQASEGALALTSEPRDADVYVNGVLKGNSTPLILRLEEGKYNIEVKKTGKQSISLEIFIADGAVLSKKVTLLDIAPPALPKNIEKELLYPKQDVFETTEEFQAHRQASLNEFNQAVEAQDRRYQAGVAYLDKDAYNIEKEIFPVRLEWQASWIQAFKLPQKGYITAARDDAKQLWVDGEEKPLYVSVILKDNQLRINQAILAGLGKMWAINLNRELPTTLLSSWQGDEDDITVATFSPDVHIFAAAKGNNIKLWEVDTGKAIHILEGHKYVVTSVTFSPNSQMLASGSMDNTIKLWDVSTGKLLSTLKSGLFSNDGHDEDVNAVAFSPDGKLLVSGGADNTIKIWKVSNGEMLHTLKGHEGEVTALAVTRREDGILLIASGSKDKTIKLWFDSVAVYTFKGHQDTILSLTFSPDGKLLASGGSDNTIKLWPTVPTCKTHTTLQGHEYEVIAIAFNHTGNLLATVSGSEIKLWEVSSGDLLYTLQEGLSEEQEIFLERAVAFSPDGRLVSGDELNTVKVWGIEN
jgi:WD40 repeat protein